MAFNVPSLADVSKIVENGFSSSFYCKSGNLRFGVLKILAKVVAAAAYLPILFCQYIWKNSFIDSCDAENLVRFGGWYNLPHKVASYSRGRIIVKGSDYIGAGTIFSDGNGYEYETIVGCRATSAGVSLQIVSINPGSKYNLVAGTALTPKVSLSVTAVVDNGGILGGVSVSVTIDGKEESWGETIEEYRQRIKYRRQNPPMGGANSDYVQWLKRFSQVTDCFVFANFPTTNSVAIYVVDNNAENPKMNETEVEEIREYICSENRKPITANVLICSPDARSLSIVVKMSNISDSVKKKALEVIKERCRKYAPGDTINVTEINSAIQASGIVENSSVEALKVNGYTFPTGKYVLARNGSSSSISGEVVNINSIDTGVTFEVLS